MSLTTGSPELVQNGQLRMGAPPLGTALSSLVKIVSWPVLPTQAVDPSNSGYAMQFSGNASAPTQQASVTITAAMAPALAAVENTTTIHIRVSAWAFLGNAALVRVWCNCLRVCGKRAPGAGHSI